MRKLTLPLFLSLLVALFLFLQKAFWCSAACFNKSEGTYWQTIRQLAAGRRLYSDIYYSQFPLFVDIAALGARLNPANDLCGARMLLNLIAASALIAIFFVARRFAGPVAGLFAALVLAAEPLYFHLSHQLTGEAASLALSLWGFFFLLRSRERLHWVWAAALFFTAAIQMKPLALLAAAIAVCMLLRWASRRLEYSRVALFICVIMLLNVLALVVSGWFNAGVGLSQLQGGYFSRFLASFFNGEFPLIGNLERIFAFRDYSRAAVLFDIPCLIAVILLLARTPRRSFAMGLASIAGGLALVLLFYVKVNTDHLIVFAPLAACGIGVTVAHWPRARLAWVTLALLVAGLLWIDVRESRDLRQRHQNAVARAQDLLAHFASQGKEVLGDDTFLITSGGRLTPPQFTDFSRARIETGSITCESLAKSLDDVTVEGFLLSEELVEQLPCGPGGKSLRDIVQAHFPFTIYRDKHYAFYGRFSSNVF